MTLPDGYAIVSQVSIDRLHGNVSVTIDAFRDEATRRAYGKLIADRAAQTVALRDAEAVLASAKGDDVAPARKTAQQAERDLFDTRTALNDPKLQRAWSTGAAVPISVLDAGNLNKIVASIYATLKADGALAGGVDC